jgi:DNA-binding MarR family transcriptional regulator
VTLPTAEGGAESRVGPITDTLGYLVAQVARLHRQRADELLGHIGLHVGQEMMLNALWTKEGVAQTELTRKMGVQPATVTNALQRLERNGLVRRTPDTEDQRVVRVFLTEAGWALRADVERQWASLDRESFDGFSGDDRDLLGGLLSRVRQNLTSAQRSG